MEQVQEKQQPETEKEWDVAKTAMGQYRVHSAGPAVRNHLTPGQHESFQLGFGYGCSRTHHFPPLYDLVKGVTNKDVTPFT